MEATVVILIKLPGHLPVKTRLWPVLGEAGARDFFRECVAKTVACAQMLTHTPVVAYSPPDADPREDLPAVRHVKWLPVEGADGGACLENALAAADEDRPLLALGGDAPDLPVSRLVDALESLATHDAVFVPTGDGGFSLLGLRHPVPGIAEGFRYGEADAIGVLREFLTSRGLKSALLEPWPDIDTPEDLKRYRERQEG